MNNYVQPGNTITLTAPSGGVVSGTAYQIGSLLVVAQTTADEGAKFEALVNGVVTLPKAASQAWTEGAKIYWNNSAAASGGQVCTTDATKGMLIGVAAAAVDDKATSTTGTVRLNGVAPAMSEGPQAAEADLVDSSGGAAANGTIEAVTAPNLENWDGAAVFPSAAQGASITAAVTALTNAVKELSTKQNATLAKLRAAGIIAAE
jgi:predicted RecA/RadA family phage recombinase